MQLNVKSQFQSGSVHKFWYYGISEQEAKAQASLRLCADMSELSWLKHMK